MYSRSKSSPGFNFNNLVASFADDSSPSSNIYNIDKVKEITNQILECNYPAEENNKSDVNNQKTWKNVTSQLVESRLTAARHPTQSTGAQGPSGDIWSREKMQEISTAMKDFIKETELKNQEYEEKIDSIERENCRLSLALNKSEMNLNKEKEEAENRIQKILSQATEKIKELETSLSETPSAAQKEIDKIMFKLKQVEREKQTLTSENSENKSEIRKLKTRIEQEELERKSVEEKLIRETALLNATKLKEKNISIELLNTKQELQDKQEEITQVLERLTSANQSRTVILNQNAELERNLKGMVNIETVMRISLENMEQKHQKHEENMIKEHNERVMQLEKDLEENRKGKQAQARTIWKLKDGIKFFQNCVDEKDVKIRQLTTRLKESVNREKMLEVRFEKLKINFTTFQDSLETKSEEKLIQNLSDTRQKLMMLSNENDKLQKVSSGQKLLLERCLSEAKETKLTLESKLKKVEEENKAFVNKIASKSHNDHCNELSNQCNHACLNQCVIKQKLDCQLKENTFVRTIEDLTSNAKTYVKERETLTRQVQELSRELDTCKYEKNTFLNEEQKHKEELVETKKILASFQLINNQLEEKCKALCGETDRYMQQQNSYVSRLKELENESQESRSKFEELKTILDYARREIAMLKTENKKWEENNAKVGTDLEKSNEENKRISDELQTKTQDVKNITSEMKRCKKDLDDTISTNKELSNINCELQCVLEEKRRQLALVVEENQYFEKGAQEIEKTLRNVEKDFKMKTKECENLKKQTLDLMGKVEELQKQMVINHQNIDEKNERMKSLKSNNKKLEEEIKKCTEVISSQKEKIETFRHTERSLENEIITLQEINKDFESNIKEKDYLCDKLKDVCFQNDALGRKLMQCETEYATLAATNNELQSKISSLSTKIIASKNKRRKLKEIVSEHRDAADKLRGKLKNLESEKKEMESQLKDCTGNLKTRKNQLNESYLTLNENHQQYNNEIQNRTVHLKDLQNENKQLKNCHKVMEEQVTSLKSTLAELYGMIDGNKHRESWVLEHRKEQESQIQNLKRDNEVLTQQITSMKEHFYKAQLTYDSLCKDLDKTRKEVDKTTRENKDLRKEVVSLSDVYKTQVSILREDLLNISNDEDSKTKAIKTLQTQNSELAKQNHEGRLNYKHLQENFVAVSTEVDRLKDELKKAMDLESEAQFRFENFKTEFLRLVNLLKQVKKERDALKTILLTTEEEKKHIKENVERLQFNLSKLQNNLQETTRDKQMILTDNETLKSKLSVLKYAESMRVTEQKHLLTKLQDYENQLKVVNSSRDDMTNEWRRKMEERKNEERKAKSNRIYESLLEELKDLFYTKCATEKAHKCSGSTIRKKVENMTDFLYEIRKKEKETQECIEYFRCNENDHRKKKSRKELILKEMRKPSRSGVERMFTESKSLQDSLFNDISNFSKSLSYSYYHNHNS